MKLTFLASLFIFCILLSPSLVFCQYKHPNPKLDPQLARDLHLFEKYCKSSPSEKFTQPCKILKSDKPLAVFIHFSPEDRSNVQSLLNELDIKYFPHSYIPPVGAHKTGFISARVKPALIRKLTKSPLIARITAGYRKLSPLNDLTAIETRAEVAWARENPITGDGIRLLVIDSGFQMDHPDLPYAAASMDYAEWPEDSSENVEDQVSAHGTHVAGTAFGSGELSFGRYKGMAPDADPIYFKIGNDENADATVEATVGAIRGAATWAQADILTISYGGFDGFNDGGAPEEQAMDFAVSRGVCCFASAGNSGARRWHYSGTVNANSTTEPIQIISRLGFEGAEWMVGLTWYDGEDTSVHVDLTAQILDGEMEQIFYDEPEWVSSPRGTEARQYLPILELPADSASYFVRVTNNSDQDQQFHLYLPEYWDLQFERASRDYLIKQPSSADSCISVAAYTQRARYTDYRGNEQFLGGVDGELARFSSRGPRIDGLRKPDIAAPGQQTVSARHLDLIPLGGHYSNRIISNFEDQSLPADYLALEGTSMSSPAAAGTAALVLQTDPQMTPAELRTLLQQNARSDNFTGNNLPNNQWGWGKIDFERSVNGNRVNPGHTFQPNDLAIHSVFPNPFNSTFRIEFSTKTAGLITFSLYTIGGRELLREKQFISKTGLHSWTPRSMHFLKISGVLILKVENSFESLTIRVVTAK